jgi:hypothetical protein
MNWVSFLLFVGLVVTFYKMTMSQKKVVSTIGVILSVLLMAVLSIKLGYVMGDRFHSCEPPPIEVFL